MSRPAVFLDRDGTINEEVEYLREPGQVRLLPGAAEAIRRLNERGFLVVVITNQAGVARGFFDEQKLREIHDELERQLARKEAHLDGIYYCPHHPTAGADPYRQDCHCRKPQTGLFERATLELDIDLARSFAVGDKLSDIQAGSQLCTTILVLTGYGKQARADSVRQGICPDFVVGDLKEAVRFILSCTKYLSINNPDGARDAKLFLDKC